MKKILIILWIISLSCNALSHEFTNKKEYTIKNKSIPNLPTVMEFFSFFCPYCYEFEQIHKMRYLIKNNIKKNLNIQRYHVNFLGGKLSYILTKSWIIAQQIGIEEKIIIPIFQGFQETHTISNLDHIKKIFKKEAGISENTFDKFWNSLTIDILTHKKDKDISRSKIDHVPIMLINGKYIIDYYRLENIFKNHFSDKYIRLIKFLINTK